jgi:hypothetical protein
VKKTTPTFVYTSFKDATGQLATPMAILQPSAEQRPLIDGTDEQHARAGTVPASGERHQAAQVKAAGALASRAAYKESLDKHPEVELDPAGGPLEQIILPQADGQRRTPNKFHVVVTADFGIYGRWQTLVGLVQLCSTLEK